MVTQAGKAAVSSKCGLFYLLNIENLPRSSINAAPGQVHYSEIINEMLPVF